MTDTTITSNISKNYSRMSYIYDNPTIKKTWKKKIIDKFVYEVQPSFIHSIVTKLKVSTYGLNLEP